MADWLAGSPLQELRQELSCPVCRLLLSSPVSLPCAHAFCRDCIDGRLAGPGVYASQCPECAAPVMRKALTRNPKLACLVESYLRLTAAPAPGNGGGGGRAGAVGGGSGDGGADAAGIGCCSLAGLEAWTARLQALDGPPTPAEATALRLCEALLQDGLERVERVLGGLLHPPSGA